MVKDNDTQTQNAESSWMKESMQEKSDIGNVGITAKFWFSVMCQREIDRYIRNNMNGWKSNWLQIEEQGEQVILIYGTLDILDISKWNAKLLE